MHMSINQDFVNNTILQCHCIEFSVNKAAVFTEVTEKLRSKKFLFARPIFIAQSGKIIETHTCYTSIV